MDNRRIITAAIGSLLMLGVLSSNAMADDKKMDMDKCFGIAKAGKNDCAGPAHACAGQSSVNAGGKEFIAVPKGTCERLAGGSLTMK